ncbi:MAG: hypothetical protein ACLR8P_23280 [Clostridium fessum]
MQGVFRSILRTGLSAVEVMCGSAIMGKMFHHDFPRSPDCALGLFDSWTCVILALISSTFYGLFGFRRLLVFGGLL